MIYFSLSDVSSKTKILLITYVLNRRIYISTLQKFRRDLVTSQGARWFLKQINWNELIIYSSELEIYFIFFSQTLAKTRRPPLGTNFSEGKQLFYDLSALHPHATIGSPNKDV